jgi:hypothetical protein
MQVSGEAASCETSPAAAVAAAEQAAQAAATLAQTRNWWQTATATLTSSNSSSSSMGSWAVSSWTVFSSYPAVRTAEGEGAAAACADATIHSGPCSDKSQHPATRATATLGRGLPEVAQIGSTRVQYHTPGQPRGSCQLCRCLGNSGAARSVPPPRL